MKTLSRYFIALFLLVCSSTWGTQILGRVTDFSGNPVEGVSVLADISALSTMTDHEGRFTITFESEAPTHITFSHISFQPVMVKVKEPYSRPLEIRLQPTVLPGQNIKVTAERAVTGLTPIAFSDFTQEDIQRDYTVAEFPLLLESTPNLYSYADAGGGLGYSYLKIRGFDDKRISVYINGVPLNDPEDQATYFVDIPDFAANVTDIQVQRGVGNSLYGDASFGGSVNIASAGPEQPRKIALSSGYGGFYADNDFVSEMRKQSVEFSSGLLDGQWSLSGRYSKQYSGGYRENSWYDGWAYYFSLSRLDPRMSTTFNIYGGPMKMHLAYYGADRETLKQNRRANWLTYDDETDNFNQPHYELHNTYQLKDNLTLRNTLYYIRGKGYYEQFRSGQDYWEYNIPPSATVDNRTEGDLIRQKWVTKNQYGWNPRLDWETDKGVTSLGGSFYYFNSTHWGQVVWAEGLTSNIDPQNRYYEYFGKKYLSSAYLHRYFYMGERIRLMGNLQLKYLHYDFDQSRLGALYGYKYDLDWVFLSPRAGISYLVNDQIDIFGSFALSSREPEDVTIYDAEDPWSTPNLEIRRISVSTSNDTTFVFGDPTVKPERLYDFELGGNIRQDRWQAGLNLFWMEFRNEIVPEGGIDESGRVRLGNAERSVHSGIELSGSFRLGESLTIGGNSSFNYNRLKEYYLYRDYDYNGTVDDTLDFSGNHIAGFPDNISNLIFDYDREPLRLTYRFRAVGRQYVENGNRKELSIEPYTVSSVTAALKVKGFDGLGRFILSATVNNIFNEKYELSGYAYETDPGEWVGEYYPAAERNFFVQLRWELE